MEALNCEFENSIVKFNDLEIQQLYGEAERKIKDANIQSILSGFDSFEEILKKRKMEEELLSKKLEQFEGDILILMNNLLNEVKKSQVNFPQSMIKNKEKFLPSLEDKELKENHEFSFCQELKSKFLEIGEKGKTLFRPSDHKNGIVNIIQD